MSIREQIMDLPNTWKDPSGFTFHRQAFNEGLEKAANLAELRERELQAQIGQMLNHLSNLQRYSKETCTGDSYMACDDKDGEWIRREDISAIINKYEVVR